PQLGMLVGLGEFDAGFITKLKPSLRASVSRNFRVPTFNELYYSGGGGIGNRALRPERSTGFDVGTSIRFLLAGEHQLQATYFVNDMTDRIVWVAAGSGTVAPRNLRRVRSEGLESSYRWSVLDRMFLLEASYTSSNSRKLSADYSGDPTVNTQLIYIPQETFNISAASTVRLDSSVVNEISGTIGYSFVGFRYHTEDNTGFLPPHRLVNAGVRTRLSVDRLALHIKCEVNNLFNEDYQVILGYPMPMRSYRLTFGIEY
ncbi:MAG: TonB-dependent receptor, partial [Bacteroidota bacterium]